jgi:hypothetical protein
VGRGVRQHALLCRVDSHVPRYETPHPNIRSLEASFSFWGC